MRHMRPIFRSPRGFELHYNPFFLRCGQCDRLFRDGRALGQVFTFNSYPGPANSEYDGWFITPQASPRYKPSRNSSLHAIALSRLRIASGTVILFLENNTYFKYLNHWQSDGREYYLSRRKVVSIVFVDTDQRFGRRCSRFDDALKGERGNSGQCTCIYVIVLKCTGELGFKFDDSALVVNLW